MRLGCAQDHVAVGDFGRAAKIVADPGDNDPQSGFARRIGQPADMAGRARASIHRGDEAAAQAFEHWQLERQIDHVLVKAAFQRRPDAAKDLGRFAEDQRLAQRLRQMGNLRRS